jgi:hypothetical protein
MSDIPSPIGSGGIRSRNDAIALAVSLAQPVIRQRLDADLAEATLAACIGRAWRLKFIDDVAEMDLIPVAVHILRLNIDMLEDKRDAISSAINRALRPMIDRAEPLGSLRAEAHNINADADALMSEDEVEQAVVHALHQAKARIQGTVRRAPPPRSHYG